SFPTRRSSDLGFDVLPRRLADHYLVYGAGTMGLIMAELAKRCGAASVSVVDLNPARLETAGQLGGVATATSAEELTRPRGWDVVIDCTGAEAAIQDGLPGRQGRDVPPVRSGQLRHPRHHRAVPDLPRGDHDHRLDGGTPQL